MAHIAASRPLRPAGEAENADDVPPVPDGCAAYRIRGGSMAPRLSEGDWVLADKPARLLRFGEIGIFRRGDAFVVHRVVGRSRQMGDAEKCCRRFSPDDVLGRVVAFARPGRIVRLTGVWQTGLGKATAARGRWRVALYGLTAGSRKGRSAGGTWKEPA